jgi:protein-tyrosine phosphatase
MDREHFDHLDAMCPAAHRHKLRMFLSYAPDCEDLDVPDPYYGADRDFDHVLDLCENAMPGLLGEKHTVT